MTQIYKIPFATTGDTESLAVNEQADGKVSLSTGFTSVYELSDDNPNYKPVGRKEMNGILNGITQAIGELQLQGGFIKWQAIDGGFNTGAVVYGSNGVLYLCSEDNNTNDPVSLNGWIKFNDIQEASLTQKGITQLSSAVDSNLETIAATSKAVKIAYDLALLAMKNYLPVGIPQPWPTTTVPSGWLKCNGSLFNKTLYPKLATVYPAGTLPDLRGEFIRGLDDGRGVDSGRVILTPQGDAIRNIEGVFNVVDQPSTTPYGAFRRIASSQAQISGSLGQVNHSNIKLDVSLEYPTANENRSRNIAFLYIVKAE